MLEDRKGRRQHEHPDGARAPQSRTCRAPWTSITSTRSRPAVRSRPASRPRSPVQIAEDVRPFQERLAGDHLLEAGSCNEIIVDAVDFSRAVPGATYRSATATDRERPEPAAPPRWSSLFPKGPRSTKSRPRRPGRTPIPPSAGSEPVAGRIAPASTFCTCSRIFSSSALSETTAPIPRPSALDPGC